MVDTFLDMAADSLVPVLSGTHCIVSCQLIGFEVVSIIGRYVLSGKKKIGCFCLDNIERR